MPARIGSRRVWVLALCSLSLAFASSACSSDASSTSGELPDASEATDTSASADTGAPVDASTDGTTDASASESGDDASDTGPAGCTRDDDCAADPKGKFCLPAADGGAGSCVPCMPGSLDTCAVGSYCVESTHTCEAGCRTTADCVTGPGDAGTGDAASGDAASGDADDAATGADAGALTCDPATHRCVGCLTDDGCPAGSVCDATTKACVPGCTATHACSAGKDCCAGSCVDEQSDTKNCGACGTVCDSTNGTATCTAGACAITCNPGFDDCDGKVSNGCEVNLDTDKTHCGACSTVCNSTNGTAACTAGVCGITCSVGFDNCDGSLANGCEVNIASDPKHCGSCAGICSATNGTASCVAGVCDIVCKIGFADCDGKLSNGCEADLQNDKTNCGACGSLCAAANASSASCIAGRCAPVCSSGYGNCDGLGSNGCETPTLADVTNCGSCGVGCSVSNGTPRCGFGVCQISSCNAGFGDCFGGYANGCETDLTSNPLNCGACGNACTVLNGTGICATSKCAVSTCNTVYRDCDGLYSTGCEANIMTDTKNCGGCGNVCATSATVVATKCAPQAAGYGCAVQTCAPGTFDKNGAFADGCECTEDTVGNTCASPLVVAPIPVGGSKVITNNLAGASIDQDWYAITFAVKPDCTWSPRIAVTGDAAAAMRIYTSCTSSIEIGPLTCGTGEPSSSGDYVGFTTWEGKMGTTTKPCGPFGEAVPGDASFAKIATLLVQVYSKPGLTGCGNYTLTINN